MKRFFTLFFALAVALVSMADSYLYIDSLEIDPSQWGSVIRVPVKAHFDARVQEIYAYVNFSPEVTLQRVEYGKDLSVTYLDETGAQQTAMPSISIDEGFNNINLMFFGQNGYWDPDGTGNYQSYGDLKFEAGDYDEMFVLYLKLADEFWGAEIFVTTEVYSSEDPRGGTVRDIGQQGQTSTQACYFVLPKTAPPVVDFTEEVDTLTVTIHSEGMLTVDWWDINDTIYSYKVERQYTPQLIEVHAWAQAYGKEPSDEIYVTYEFAGKPRPVAEPPMICWEYSDTAVRIYVRGSGPYMFVGDQAMPNSFVVPRTDRDSVISVWAYAQGGINLPSDTVYNDVVIPALNAAVTDPPTLRIGQEDEYYKFTAVGNGELKLYINGREVENGYNFPRPEPREYSANVSIAATAQEEGKCISTKRFWAQWVSPKTLFYDFIEDSIYYLITDVGTVSVSHKDYSQHYKGDLVIPDYVTHDGVTYMVTGIHLGTFSLCRELNSVKFGANLTSIGVHAFFHCENLTEVTLGDYVTDIEELAFYNCSNLKKVTLGSGVARIAKEAFNYCDALTDIVCKAATPPVMEQPENCFSTYGTATLHVHPSVLKRYQQADGWANFGSIVGESFINPTPGDVNCDGQISISDVSRLIDMLLDM